MGKTGSITLALSMLGGLCWMAYMSESTLSGPTELLRSLGRGPSQEASQTKAEPDDAPPEQVGLDNLEQPLRPTEVSQSTAAKVSQITPGMSREQVHAILGPPGMVMTRTRRRADGREVKIESATWPIGHDSVMVRFCDGVVQMLVSTPTPALPVAKSPTARAPGKAGARKADKSKKDAGVGKAWAKLKQYIEAGGPDEFFKQMVEGTAERKQAPAAPP